MEKPYEYYLKYLSPLHKGSLVNRKPTIKLIDRLQRKRILYINAPIGYGKTTAVIEWLQKTKYESIWLTLDKYDEDRLEFCRDLILALSKFFKDNERLKAIVTETDIYNMSLECAYFAFDSIKKPPSPFVLVLDDFQCAANESNIDLLSELVKRLPDNGYVILLDDGIPGQATEKLLKKTFVSSLPADKLKFDAANTQSLLKARGFPIDKEQAECIAAKMNGSPLLLSLLTAEDIAAYGNECTNAPPGQISSTEFDTAAFVKARVIDQMDSSQQLFHMKIAAADVVDAELCLYLTGEADGLSYIEDLADRTGLILKLENGFYRYHPMLREILLEMLLNGISVNLYDIYMKLAEWEHIHKNYIKAIDYYISIGESQSILQLLQQLSSPDAANYGFGKYAGCIRERLRNTSAITDLFTHHTTLSYFAWTAFLEGNITAFIQWAEQLKQLPNSQQATKRKDQCLTRYIAMINPRSNIWATMESFRKEGTDLNNRQRGECPFINFSFSLPTFHNSIIDFSILSDKLTDFFDEYTHSLKKLWKTAALIFENLIRSGLCFEKKQLDDAMMYALNAKKHINKNTQPEIIYCVYMMLGEIYDSLNQMDDYKAAMRYAQEIIQANQLYYLLPNYRAVNTTKLILRGNKNVLSGWLEKVTPKTASEVNFYTHRQHFVTARCFTATARFKDAIHLLEKIEAFCIDFNRTIDLIGVQILLSVNYWNLQNKNRSLDYMAAALIQAQKYGYITLFAREAHDIAPILKKIANKISRGGMPEIEKRYIKSILIHTNNFKSNTDTIGMTSLSGVKPKRLSKQQTLMLHYLAKGMTYLEICAETGLKITSVREHITKLYAKLSVHNSADMLKRAKELNLL